MTYIHPLEDKYKEVSQLNSDLSARNQELEAQLVEESQAKNGNIPTTPYFCNRGHASGC
jgi:cell division septum initiation protein DivIVA